MKIQRGSVQVRKKCRGVLKLVSFFLNCSYMVINERFFQFCYDLFLLARNCELSVDQSVISKRQSARKTPSKFLVSVSTEPKSMAQALLLLLIASSIGLSASGDDYQPRQSTSSFQKTIPSLKGLLQEDELNQQRQRPVNFKKPVERQEYVFTKETINRETPSTKGDHQRVYEHSLSQQINELNQHSVSQQNLNQHTVNQLNQQHLNQQNQRPVLDNINRIKELNKYSEEIAKDLENYDLKFNRPSMEDIHKHEIERENSLPDVNFKPFPINTTNNLLPELPDITNCPVCFKLVKEQVIEEYGMLKRLTDQLEYIKNYPEVIQDLSFQFRLRELASLVDGMLKDARYSQSDEQNIIKAIQDLKDRIRKLTIIRDQITQLPEIEKHLIYSSSNMSIIDDIIRQIQSGVDNSRKFLDNQVNLHTQSSIPNDGNLSPRNLQAFVILIISFFHHREFTHCRRPGNDPASSPDKMID